MKSIIVDTGAWAEVLSWLGVDEKPETIGGIRNGKVIKVDLASMLELIDEIE